MIDRLRDYQSRVPFATAHAIIDAQLMRLTGLEVNEATIPIAGEEGQSPASPWNDVPSPAHSDLDGNMDCTDPVSPSGNL